MNLCAVFHAIAKRTSPRGRTHYKSDFVSVGLPCFASPIASTVENNRERRSCCNHLCARCGMKVFLRAKLSVTGNRVQHSAHRIRTRWRGIQRVWAPKALSLRRSELVSNPTQIARVRAVPVTVRTRKPCALKPPKFLEGDPVSLRPGKRSSRANQCTRDEIGAGIGKRIFLSLGAASRAA